MLRKDAVRSWALAGALLLVAPAPGLEGASDDRRAVSDAHGDGVLARFLARPDESHPRFRVRRHMRAEGLGKRAFMDVRVEVDPENGFRFQVEAEGGSRLFLDRAFRVSLAKEQEIHALGAVSRAAFTSENYLFNPLGAEDDGHARLRALPRRSETSLLDGVVVVTADSADIVRVEGRLARSPSFWVPRVDVVRHFRRLQGHRVQVRLESVAHFRLFGEVCIVVDFDYEMVDGDDIASPPRRPWGQGDGTLNNGEMAGCRSLPSGNRASPRSGRTLASAAPPETGSPTRIP